MNLLLLIVFRRKLGSKFCGGVLLLVFLQRPLHTRTALARALVLVASYVGSVYFHIYVFHRPAGAYCATSTTLCCDRHIGQLLMTAALFYVIFSHATPLRYPDNDVRA